MSTKFFNNNTGNTLYNKLISIAHDMKDFYAFQAVVGFFRSSGYFKLREQLKDVAKIQILVGINVDNIFRTHNRALLLLGKEEEAKKIFNDDFVNDIKTARYDSDVEKGILQLCEDIASKKVELKIHKSKNLHAKFYLCLPENHTESSDGWVIMGSSNISEAGLGISEPPRYELNVAMKDYDDVAFCKSEFDGLWNEGVEITADDIEKSKKRTYLGAKPTPYELYMKVLIDSFGEQVEDDFNMDLPKGVKDLKYQKDAVVQGYQMLCAHNGFFLADVVGLGKTIVATMIAKRFIEANGKNTNVLVIYPPAVEQAWKEAFETFGIKVKAQFISNGSLSKVLQGKENYKSKEEFDLVIVDEAHGFRNDVSNKYDELQRICKAPRHIGLVKGLKKKVMLLSATPLNNRPEDLRNLILLFEDATHPTIEGISNISDFFAPKIADYKRIMKNRQKTGDTKTINAQIDSLYAGIREKILNKITIRRTRHNILNDDFYRHDLEKQKIVFPNILQPQELVYALDEKLAQLFSYTLDQLTDTPDIGGSKGNGLYYARYRAVEHFVPEIAKMPKYQSVTRAGENLAGIYRVHMVKRLESSFEAFKKSLKTLLKITEDMIRMFEEDRVIIAPELDVKELLAKGWKYDRILEYAESKGYSKSDIVYKASDFIDSFLPKLKADEKKLEELNSRWDSITEDPKLDLFFDAFQQIFFDEKINRTGKLVIFSESVDTINYLYDKITEKTKRKDLLKISSENRTRQLNAIRENFDANYVKQKQSDTYNVLITSDVLSEGVNLHRANVIVNYDSPWNATRLMQRIGRVNRIGSVASSIHNYMFYPSKQGNQVIKLYENALIKLQSFHSALGEDAQVYSKEEILKEFELYNSSVKDTIDEQLMYLREVRDLFNKDREQYDKIKALPLKSRVARKAVTEDVQGSTVAFISSPLKTEYYEITDKPRQIDFLNALKLFKAEKNEAAENFTKAASYHYKQVNEAIAEFQASLQKIFDNQSLTNKTNALNKNLGYAVKFLKIYANLFDSELEKKQKCTELQQYINDGTYSNLTKEVAKFAKNFKNDKREMSGKEPFNKISQQIDEWYENYSVPVSKEDTSLIDNTAPTIVVSESFV